jgi:hypothetical protein
MKRCTVLGLDSSFYCTRGLRLRDRWDQQDCCQAQVAIRQRANPSRPWKLALNQQQIPKMHAGPGPIGKLGQRARQCMLPPLREMSERRRHSIRVQYPTHQSCYHGRSWEIRPLFLGYTALPQSFCGPARPSTSVDPLVQSTVAECAGSRQLAHPPLHN